MDTLTESSVLGTLFLRFCLCVAERECEYSMVFTVSNAHHRFWDRMSFVMIIVKFRASIGEPFNRFCDFWVPFSQCCFLPLLKGRE